MPRDAMLRQCWPKARRWCWHAAAKPWFFRRAALRRGHAIGPVVRPIHQRAGARRPLVQPLRRQIPSHRRGRRQRPARMARGAGTPRVDTVTTMVRNGPRSAPRRRRWALPVNPWVEHDLRLQRRCAARRNLGRTVRKQDARHAVLHLAEIADAAQVRFLAAWQPPERVEEAFPNLEIVFSWALGWTSSTFRRCRDIESGCAWWNPADGLHVRVRELGVLSLPAMSPVPAAAATRRVERNPVRPASSRRVGVMGMGTLGRAALAQLHQLGFDCAGWSVHAVTMPASAATGRGGARDFLARTDILVCMLPLTPETRGILGRPFSTPCGAALAVNARTRRANGCSRTCGMP